MDRILLTGATGYVGGRLRRALEADGRPLRGMLRGLSRAAREEGHVATAATSTGA